MNNFRLHSWASSRLLMMGFGRAFRVAYWNCGCFGAMGEDWVSRMRGRLFTSRSDRARGGVAEKARIGEELRGDEKMGWNADASKPEYT